MKTNPRISSILHSNHLAEAITDIPAFDLSTLQQKDQLDFELPTNVRLGHLAEKVISEAIKASSNYDVLYENIQIVKDKNTIGEIDFIIQELETKNTIHLELAYKFYLLDPSISDQILDNWIGPNRNDSLRQKLNKLKKKQFPLLYRESAKRHFGSVNIEQVSQSLCILVSLYVPFKFEPTLKPAYQNAVKGYYLNLETFINLHDSDKSYHLPSKKEWGIDPAENKNWTDFEGIEKYIITSMDQKQAPLVWQQFKGEYIEFFIVWW